MGGAAGIQDGSREWKTGKRWWPARERESQQRGGLWWPGGLGSPKNVKRKKKIQISQMHSVKEEENKIHKLINI